MAVETRVPLVDGGAGWAALVADLQAVMAPSRVKSARAELALYGRDASVIEGVAGVVCLPVSTSEVAAAILVSRAHGRPIVPRGSGTGLAGGAVPVGESPPVVIVTTKMNEILDVDPA